MRLSRSDMWLDGYRQNKQVGVIGVLLLIDIVKMSDACNGRDVGCEE